AEAIRWANSEGLMDGYGNDRFGPNDTMTREQLVTVMYRYAQRKGIDVSVGEDTNILSYDDALDVSEWAASAMQWAVGSGLISGRTSSTLNPKDTATRAEIATIMMRYCTEIAE
ncbi:MAG: S-layer homology domain-containing protein, partial [Acidaminococcaceae bacterium]|nr:S-layer homology domain-containing protein [Acidaminococcaceae bacterium]